MPSLSRPDSPEHPVLVSKKKALLIGIQGGEDGKLDCPHHDVRELEKVLLKIYRYDPKDIVTMLDGVGNADLEPTRANILREVVSLVEDAQPGDHFMFHYAGHSTQLPGSISEEDGKDEYLVPIDAKGNNNLIKDNELRELLVDGLPMGSKLVAIFDSCHSESMLDLEHHRCNRVFTPWISKGKRQSDPKRNAVVRHNDIDPWVTRTNARPAVRKPSTLDLVPGSWTSHQHKVASLKANPLTSHMKLQTWTAYFDSPTSPMLFTESPVSLYCTGFCDHALAQTTKTAYVLSFSACKDRQRAWENARDKESLTMAMICILQETPNPTLKDLMTNLSHRTYELNFRLHQAARQWRKENRPPINNIAPDEAQEENPLEMDNFQDPQLASHSPLDMNAIFTL